MARTAEFEQQAALQAAMNLFWERGYEHCSLADLLARMNIGNSSFYNAFGSKKQVFVRCLDMYYSELAERMRQLRQAPGPVRDKVRAIFTYTIDRQQDRYSPKGCFITNSIAADALEDQDIRRQVRYYLDEFEHAIELIIRDGVATGELASSVEPRSTAAILNFYLQGLQKLSLLEYSHVQLREQTAHLLRSLGL